MIYTLQPPAPLHHTTTPVRNLPKITFYYAHFFFTHVEFLIRCLISQLLWIVIILRHDIVYASRVLSLLYVVVGYNPARVEEAEQRPCYSHVDVLSEGLWGFYVCCNGSLSLFELITQ